MYLENGHPVFIRGMYVLLFVFIFFYFYLLYLFILIRGRGPKAGIEPKAGTLFSFGVSKDGAP